MPFPTITKYKEETKNVKVLYFIYNLFITGEGGLNHEII